MTEEELAEIEARASLATAGPWTAEHRSVGCTAANDEASGLGLDVCGPPEPMHRGTYARGADARFVAAARDDIPRLVAEVRRLRHMAEVLLVTVNLEGLLPPLREEQT